MRTKEQLVERCQYLQKVVKEKENALLKAPAGTLRVMRQGGNMRYYLRKEEYPNDTIYLPKEKLRLVRELAQKDYDQKVLRSVSKELQAIDKYLHYCPVIKAEQIYETLHKGKQSLVTPLRPSDEEYIRSWEAVQYEGKSFDENVPEFYSGKGERVRSKSEVIIADMLYQMGIPYRYEYPLYLRGLGEIHPDFTVLNVRERKEIYWEHFGRMDDADYAERAVKKINCFRQNGYYEGENTMYTYETGKQPLNQKLIRALNEHKLR